MYSDVNPAYLNRSIFIREGSSLSSVLVRDMYVSDGFQCSKKKKKREKDKGVPSFDLDSACMEEDCSLV